MPVRIANEIRMSIIEGRLLPGRKLNAEEIAASLSVSRTPVREAFRILEMQGLVEVNARRGVFVKSSSLKDLIDVGNLRSVLESLAVCLSLTSEDKQAWISSLRLITSEMRQSVIGKPLIDCHTKFHKLLVSHSDNKKLGIILESIQTEVNMYMYFLDGSYDDAFAMAKEHDELIDTIEKGDALLVARVVENHVTDGLSKLVKNWGRQVKGSAQ